MEIAGFVLTPWKHPNGYSKAFPKGTWYGRIDGYDCTGPCTSPDAALYYAYQALIHKGYRVSLLTHIETFEHWLKNPTEPYASQAKAELVDLHARLAKLDRFQKAH